MSASAHSERHASTLLRSFRWLRDWWAVLGAYMVLYLPTYHRLAIDAWPDERNGHGPFILAIAAALFWQRRGVLKTETRTSAPVIGSMVLFFGLSLYAVGRSQHILLFEAGSQIPVVLGLILLFRGWPSLARLWFPVLFLAFLVPLPGFLVDGLTNPLKQLVSQVVADGMYALGYPVARDGVILAVGPYQLLVADACSGLDSMFSLSAMGLLYLYVVGHGSWVRNALIVALIPPISFIANIVRVVILVLLTYHFGDSVGQGFLHGFAGLLLFSTALLGVFLADSIVDLVLKAKRRTMGVSA